MGNQPCIASSSDTPGEHHPNKYNPDDDPNANANAIDFESQEREAARAGNEDLAPGTTENRARDPKLQDKAPYDGPAKSNEQQGDVSADEKIIKDKEELENRTTRNPYGSTQTA